MAMIHRVSSGRTVEMPPEIGNSVTGAATSVKADNVVPSVMEAAVVAKAEVSIAVTASPHENMMANRDALTSIRNVHRHRTTRQTCDQQIGLTVDDHQTLTRMSRDANSTKACSAN